MRQELRVFGDIFKDGYDVLAAVLKWRVLGSTAWLETPMIPGDNDRWSAVCHFTENATYEFTIEAWGDEFNSWAVEFQKKFAAGITDLATEIEEGAISLEHAAARATRKSDQDRLASLAKELNASKPAIGAAMPKNPDQVG